jgi:hypothetical protein
LEEKDGLDYYAEIPFRVGVIIFEVPHVALLNGQT